MIKLNPVCILPENNSRHTLLELALILPVKFHTSSHKRILGLSDIILMVCISQTSLLTRGVLMQLHQAVFSIRKAGRRTELASPIPHVINIHMNGTSYLAQRIPSCFPTQRGFQKKRKKSVTKRDPQMRAPVLSRQLLNMRKIEL